MPNHLAYFEYARFRCLELVNLPALSHEDDELFRASLRAKTPSQLARAASTWESLLERHQTPFLMVRVADVRASLGSFHTALELYSMAQKLLGSGHDRLFDAWLRKFSPLVKDRVLENGIRELELQEQTIANAGKDQVWQVQTSISHHPVNFSRPGFPLEELAKDIKSRWASLQSHSANHNHGALFWRLHCVETNLLEGTFALTRESKWDLVRQGVTNGRIDATLGAAHDDSFIRSILKDTFDAWGIIETICADPDLLDLDMLKLLHNCLMHSCRVLPTRDDLVYINVGRTRTESKASRFIRDKSGAVVVSFCPFRSVDAEISRLCKIAVPWVSKDLGRNAFMVAAWLHLMFVRIHPFEDGNGRLCRVLASVPLLKAGYPPLVIPTTMRHTYYAALNDAWAGNFEPLVSCFIEGMEQSLREYEEEVSARK